MCKLRSHLVISAGQFAGSFEPGNRLRKHPFLLIRPSEAFDRGKKLGSRTFLSYDRERYRRRYPDKIHVQHPTGESPSLPIDYLCSVDPATGKLTFKSGSGGLIGFLISKSKMVLIPSGFSQPQLIFAQ
jgi:hypothetical protein